MTHAFVVSGARAAADAAASQGLRAGWAEVQDHPTFAPSPEFLVAAVTAAVDRSVAGSSDGWRWWHPQAVTVFSDLCAATPPPLTEPGWLYVHVQGSAPGPLTMVSPDRWEPVYASAEGPARLTLAAGATLSPPDDPTLAAWRC